MTAITAALALVLSVGAPAGDPLKTATGKTFPKGTSILSYSIW